MLNNLIAKYNPGFGYVNPRMGDLDNHKVVNGWFKTNGFGSVEFFVYISPAYLTVPPETAIYGRFLERYLDSQLKRHLYHYRIGGNEILVICGDKDLLYRWSGRWGVAHYISKVLIPWIHLESKALARELGKITRYFSE
jgi:hypothetical protein